MDKFQQQSNKDKASRGANAQCSFKDLLLMLKYNNYIKKIYSLDENVGYKLYAPFVIEFNDENQWALYTTTSCRSDRLKMQHWDSLLVKSFTGISKCYLIYPEGISDKEIREFKRNDRIIREIQQSNIALPELDGILSQSEFFHLVEKYVNETVASGKRHAKQGTVFEQQIAQILNNQSNLKRWKGNKLESGVEYRLFEYILNTFKCPHNIAAINARTDIPRLVTGGNPKTDILVDIYINSSIC